MGPLRTLNRDISDEEDCCDLDDRDILEEEDFVDSDDGSFADLDRDMSDEEDCCDSDVGSVADLEWECTIYPRQTGWRPSATVRATR